MGDGSWRWLLQFNVNEGLSDLAQPTSALIRKVSPEYSVVMSFSGAGGTRHDGFYAYSLLPIFEGSVWRMVGCAAKSM